MGGGSPRILIRRRIDMDGDEEVGIGTVGDFSPLGKFHILIGGTRIDNLHVRIVFPNKLSQLLGYAEGHILLVIVSVHASGVLSPMPRVEHHLAHLSPLGGLRVLCTRFPTGTQHKEGGCRYE